jgi:2'-5' RNA ligase
MHRLFFAVIPDAAAREAIAARVAVLARDPPGGWIEPSRWHLTLAFLGQWATYPDDVAARAIAAADAVRAPAFALQLEWLDHFSGRRPPWFLRPASPHAALAQLAAQVRAQLDAAGIAPDARSFAPHLTLRRGTLRATPQAVAPVAWTVDAFGLWHSAPGQGPYRCVQRWALSR